VTIVEQGAPALGPFVPNLLADWRRVPNRRWWRTDGSLLSADISGFTKLSERLAGLGKEGAEELTDLINECFDGMIDVATAHGGDVLKFGGDALLLLFTGPDHVDRACAAAIGMRASITRPLRTRSVARVALKMSQGIHRGELLFFVIDAGHHELLVTGPGATSTVECESTASAGEILLSPGAAAAAPPAWLGGERDGGGRLLRRIGPVQTYVDPPDREPRGSWLEDMISPAQREQIEAGVVGEHRHVTTAFVKFSHVDDLVERAGPEDVASRLGELAATVRRAADRYGIHWLGTDIAPDGGKVILTAGAPVSAGDDEERMLRAVHDVVSADPGLHLRAGVNAGPVFAGIVGSGRRRVYTVMGDAVNLAARLMQRAEAGQVLATLDTVDRSATRFDLAPLPPFLVKGKAAPIRAGAVGGVRETGGRPAVVHGGVPLVGREVELETLDRAVASSTEGATVLVDVVGEVGLGKSRLLGELQRRHPDHITLIAAGGQYTRSTPYFALRRALRRLLDVPVDGSPTEAGHALAAAVKSIAPPLLPWLPLLALPVDADVPATPEVDQLAPAFRRNRLHAAVVELLESVPGGPLLLVVDDAHWLDEASCDLLEHVTTIERRAGTTIVVAREPGSVAIAPVEGEAVRIALGALDGRATEELVVSAATVDLLPDVVEAIVEHSGGHPLFAIELARTARSGGRGALPDSVESLVTVRIDTLPAGARRLLREVSVLGARVDRQLAASAFNLDPDDTSTWEQLDGFLEPRPDGTLRFRHSTFRTVAYEGLPFRRRRELHERVGRALEGGATDELLSLHFHRAQVGRETWSYSRRAGEQARRKYANVEAAELFRRALDGAGWAKDLPDAEVRDVWVALGDVCELSARYVDASEAYAKAQRQSRGDTRREVEILEKRGVVCERSGRYSAALRWYGRSLRLAESLPPPDAAAATGSLARAYAGVRYRQGRWAECVRWAKRAAQEAEAIGDRSGLAHAWYLLDIALGSLGSPEAEEYQGRSLPVFEELGDLVGQANALNNEGSNAYYASRWREAVDCYERSERARIRAGDVVGAATQANNLGELRSDQGRLDEARALFERALRTWRAASYPVGIAYALSNLGRAEARAGAHDRALMLLEEARTRFEAIGAAALAIEAEVRMVECLVYAGRHREAAERIATLAPQIHEGAGDDLLRVLLDRLVGWVRLRTGDPTGATRAFEGSISRAEALGARFEAALSFLAIAEVPALDDERRARCRAAAASTLAELDVVAVPQPP
jgi:class 3 adenylate cyclase/tetratricopeptide (TPR) repeat protein